jgi:ubiquinone/menaquinone biosynthesis C-methylase UbiE
MSTSIVSILDFESLSNCPVCNSTGLAMLDAEYNVCRCEQCGFVFDNPRPTLESLIRFYSAETKYDGWLQEEAARDRLWRRRLRRFLPHAKPGNLLDVGTGTGQFLAVARGYFKDVCGTEISESAIEIARTKYNLNLMQGEVEDMSLPPGAFDNVTLFHVLEHVPDPMKLLERCRRLLCENGILLVCVPNDVLACTSKIKSLGRRLGVNRFRKFSPRVGLPRAGTSQEVHLSHFTPDVLQKAVEQSGFVVREIGLDPYFAAPGFKLLLHTAYYRIHRALFTLSNVNRYDTIWLVAQRVAAGDRDGLASTTDSR